MDTIIAGRFDEQTRAEQAGTALEATGFRRQQIATFFVNPPGQHDLSGTPKDPDASAGAHHAGEGAGKGAVSGAGVGAVVGLVTVPVLGPAGAAVGAAIGAYVGSLAGALDNLEAPVAQPGESVSSAPSADDEPPRRGGMVVAIAAATSQEEATAIGVLRAQGAADIERAEGTITQSQWNDFDPLTTLRLVPTAETRT